MDKKPDAFRTISEVSEWLDTPTYVLRFWESRFPQIKPVKRAGGRRYYRPEDMMLLGGIKKLLHFDEHTIKAVKGMLKDEGVQHVMDLSPDLNTKVVSPVANAKPTDADEIDKMVEQSTAELQEQRAEAAAEEAAAEVETKIPPKVEVRVVKKGKVQEVHLDAVADTSADDGASEVEPEDKPEEPELSDKQKAKAAKAAKRAAKKAAKKAALLAAAESQKADADADSQDAVEDQEGEAPAPVKGVAPVGPLPVEDDGVSDEEEDDDDDEGNTEDWHNMEVDMIARGPYAIGAVSSYSADELAEIETLYYSLRMVRNNMRRALKKARKNG